jgi:hypothetical protein
MNKAALLGIALVGLMFHDARAGSAVAIGSTAKNPHPVESVGYPKEVAIQRALRICFEKGGVNARIIAATDKVGYGAVAVAAKPGAKGSIIGVALGKRSKKEAEILAIEHCLTAGGVNPHLIRRFKDTYSPGT